MTNVIIYHEKCDGSQCGECTDACSMDILILDGDKIGIQNPEECSLCEICVDICPNGAIKLQE